MANGGACERRSDRRWYVEVGTAATKGEPGLPPLPLSCRVQVQPGTRPASCSGHPLRQATRRVRMALSSVAKTSGKRIQSYGGRFTDRGVRRILRGGNHRARLHRLCRRPPPIAGPASIAPSALTLALTRGGGVSRLVLRAARM